MSRSKRRRGEQRSGTCVYCGKEGLITDDHVFPQAIFLVLDEQMITVPACDECQHIKSLGDRDLRNFIILDIGGSQHPDAIELAQRMIKESNVRLRVWLQKMLAAAKEVELVTDAGVVIGKALEFEFNMDRIMVAHQMVVRGLHYHETKTILPAGYPIFVEHIPWNAAPKFVKDLSAKAPFKITAKGKNVAWWSSHPMQGMPAETRTWIICYNNWVLFVGTTGKVAVSTQKLRAEHLDRQEQRKAFAGTIERVGPRRVVVPRDPLGHPIIPPQ